jgi:hypothetical protein
MYKSKGSDGRKTTTRNYWLRVERFGEGGGRGGGELDMTPWPD